MEIPKQIENEIKKDKSIIAVILFGSYARKEYYRDIDICLVLDKKYPSKEMTDKLIIYSGKSPDKYDIKIFQLLPLYIRKRILEEGKVLLCKNEDLLYEIAFQTIKEFEFYKKTYYNYLKSIEEEYEKRNR